MRRLLAVWYRQLAVRLAIAGSDAQFLVGDTGEEELSWLTMNDSPCETLAEWYFDGTSRLASEPPSSDGGNAKPDEPKGEMDKP